MTAIAGELPADGGPVPGGLGVAKQAGQVQDDAAGHMAAEVGGKGIAQRVRTGMRGTIKISLMNHSGLAAPAL